eukprot:c23746_g1_i1 orf=473-1795(+)
MRFTSGEDRLHRRNAHSLDLDRSAAKAAAWVWHLHATSKPEISTEGRYISSECRRRRSSSCDRKSSRFQQEAASTVSTGVGRMKPEMLLWDCGSELYDTFELVSFSNRLDRSLMGVVPIPPFQEEPPESNHIKSPPHQPGSIFRTLSMPQRLSRQTSKKSVVTALSPNPENLMPSNSEHGIASRQSPTSPSTCLDQIKAPKRWASVGKFMKAIKKVVGLHKQVTFAGCKENTNIIEPSQRQLDPINRTNYKSHYEGDELSVQFDKVESIKESIDDKSFIHCKDKSNVIKSNNIGDKLSHNKKTESINESNKGDKLCMHKKIRSSYSRSTRGDDLFMHRMVKPNNEAINDGLVKQKMINPGRNSIGEELLIDDNGIKGVNYVRERILKEQNIEPQNHQYTYLHHHHHHHHHHYLHHTVTSESARLSPETMSQICAEESWLT